MSLPELCIRRPVMTSLLMPSFIVYGLFGYRALPPRPTASPPPPSEPSAPGGVNEHRDDQQQAD